jgi:hypothetical protein
MNQDYNWQISRVYISNSRKELYIFVGGDSDVLTSFKEIGHDRMLDN